MEKYVEITESSNLTEVDTLKTGWKNPPTLSGLQSDLNLAQSDNTHVERINRWLDFMKISGQAAIKTEKGRSQYVNKMIKKNALWKYAPLSEPFLANDDLIKAKPITYEDVKPARLNSLLVNQQINNSLDKVSFINELIRTVVDEGTAIVRTGWFTHEVTETQLVPVFEYTPNNSMVNVLQQVDDIYNNQPHLYNDLPDEVRESYEHFLRTNEVMEVTITEYKEEEVTRTLKNHPTWEIVEYPSITYDPTCKGKMEKARFVIHTTETSLAELTEAGIYHNLDQVLIETTRDGINDSRHLDDPSFIFSDKARKKLTMHEYWGYYDIHGNNTLVPIVCAWIGNTLIRMEESPYPDNELPFVAIVHEPVKNELFGEPDAELLIDNQLVYSAVARGIMDILGRSAAGQIGYRKGVLDPANAKKFREGRDFEFNGSGDPSQHFYMHNFPEISQSAAFMLQMQTTDAETLTGVKAFSNTGISGSAYGENVGGIRTALDAVSKRETDILRRIANGITKIARKFVSMNAVYLNEEEVVRITNERFEVVKRDDLTGSFDLFIDIASAEEDEAKAQQLAFMLQATGDADSPEVRRMILAKIARLRKMPDLAHELENYQPQPDPVQQQLQMLEIERQRVEIMKERALAEKALAEARKAGSDADLKDLTYLEQETGTTHAREVEKQQAQAQGNIQLELVKNTLDKIKTKPTNTQENVDE